MCSLQVNANRTTALEVLSAPGSLLVLCSLVENMPYVVAEAIVSHLPFLCMNRFIAAVCPAWHCIAACKLYRQESQPCSPVYCCSLQFCLMVYDRNPPGLQRQSGHGL